VCRKIAARFGVNFETVQRPTSIDMIPFRTFCLILSGEWLGDDDAYPVERAADPLSPRHSG
jgi:hypothetical protein